MDADRSWIVAALALVLSGCGVNDAPTPTPAPGAFDAAFGSQGIAIVAPPGDSRSYAAFAAVDGQGRVVVAGSEVPLGFTGLRYRSLFARFTREGVPDAAWGANGLFRPPVDPAVEREGTWVAALSDDRTALGERLAVRCGIAGQPGCGAIGQVNNFFAQRHRPDGGIDDTYGVMSTVSIAVTRPAVVSFGGGALATFGVTNVPTVEGGARAVFQVRRVDERGQLELPWAIAAEAAMNDVLGGTMPEDVKALLVPEGRVVVALQLGSRILLTRIAANGGLDRAYGTQGIVSLPLPGLAGFQRLDQLVARAAGAVAVVAHSLSPVPTSGRIVTAIAWIGPEGAPEASLPAGAVVEIDPSLMALVQAATAEPDGRVLLAGFATVPQAPPAPGVRLDEAHPRIVRIDTSGRPDPAFGPAGAGYAPLESGGMTLGPRHLVRAADGSLYVAGTVPSDPSALTPTAFAVGKLGS